jgi:hypothetical protein
MTKRTVRNDDLFIIPHIDIIPLIAWNLPQNSPQLPVSPVLGLHISCKRQSDRVTRTVLLKLLDHAIEIGIAASKASCEQIPAALGNLLAVRNYLKLTCLTRCKYGFNA